jgi:protoporphyrinogen oxidase
MKQIILGAGMTGLAAGLAADLPIYEAQEAPGGICSSYYVHSGDSQRLQTAPKDGEAYRFEIGGGHWIFGGDPLVLRFIRSLTPVKSYVRKSAVYMPDQELLVPYPLQNHLRCLDTRVAMQALREIVNTTMSNHPVTTMAAWLRASFGPTLCELFFDPFHELYTAGLWKDIAPQDVYKSPVDISHAIQGAFDEVPPVGYNATFIYPIEGLNSLARQMAEQCDVHYGKRAVKIDVKERSIYFADGSVANYETLLSTLSLNHMMKLTGLSVDAQPHPSPSVLVINIGALRGPHCPQDHWVYIPRSKARFHRVGFYSNVDASFLPASVRVARDRASIYVEKAYPEGQQPAEAEITALCRDVVRELQEWEWIGDVEVVDPTWIDVGYTWSWPGSGWREKALQTLEAQDIFQVGRFARWVFQGIADSIRDGLLAGATMMKAVR